MKAARHFDDFPPYSPVEPFDVLSGRLGIPAEKIIKLDANENPYGPSPRVRQVLGELVYTHIYPDPESRVLRKALSQFTGVPAENLLAGAGSDELLDLLLRVMLEPGDVVMSFPPTFGMYAFDSNLNAARLVEIPRHTDFSLDLTGILANFEKSQPKVIFLASPNNPDGSMLTHDDLDTLTSLPSLVVLDEAYIEFSGKNLGQENSRIRLVPQRDNLVVLRTFSKWAGLAGLRVGYGAFPAWLMPVMWKAKQPYNVNVAASCAALASLEDLDTLEGNVDRLCRERERLFVALQAFPFLHPYPSQANFVLCKVIGLSAKTIKADLLHRGILVRYYDTDLLRDFIRISVGRAQDTELLLQALHQIRS